MCRNLPFEKPIAAVRVGGCWSGSWWQIRRCGTRRKVCSNIVIAGTEEAIVMVSLARWKVSEESVVDALEFRARADQEDRGAIKELSRRLIDQGEGRAAAVDEACTKRLRRSTAIACTMRSIRRSTPKKDSYHLVDALKGEDCRGHSGRG